MHVHAEVVQYGILFLFISTKYTRISNDNIRLYKDDINYDLCSIDIYGKMIIIYMIHFYRKFMSDHMTFSSL